jgi:uncharacterized protein (TIGR02246 family)
MRRATMVVAGLALAAVTLFHLLPAGARPDAPASAEETAIRKMLSGYVAAYNKGDADVTSLFFATDCEFNDDDGRVLKGRDAIRKDLEQLFKTTKGLKLDAALESIRKLSNDAYNVRGSATVTRPDGTANKSEYVLVVAKRDGNWLIADARELDSDATAAASNPLEALSWMVGEWSDTSDDLDVTAHCDWAASKHFLVRSHTVTVNGELELAGTEVITYDPTVKQIRSWMFDSDGTVTESTWSQQGNVWTVKAKGFLADGKKASATHLYTVVDDNTITYASTNRDVGGQLQPNVPEVKMVRNVAEQQPTAPNPE